MRRSSKGRARWRQDAVDLERAPVPKRVTPHLPREGRPVFWKCGMSFSPSFSSRWLKSTKGQPQIFAARRRLLKGPISTCLGVFPGLLAALQCVDLVTIFPEMRATQFIGASHPAIYVKGGDYSPETLNEEERALLEEIGAEIRFIPFEAGYSTSRLLEQICKSGS